MCAPLTNLTRKDAPFRWGPEQQTAFESIKAALTHAPVLALPDWQDAETPYVMITDASYHGLAGVLMQKGRPISYESRKLNSAESRYSPTELEMLAVVHCCKVWRCYIEGRDVHVYTDHKPNTYLSTQNMLNRRQARWVELLQGHNIQWFYKPGPLNPADGPSRSPVNDAPPDSVLVAVLRPQIPAVNKLSKCTEQPAFVDQVTAGYQEDTWFSTKNNTAPLSFCKGLYYKGTALCIPNVGDLRAELLKECHSTPYAAHTGRDIFGGLVWLRMLPSMWHIVTVVNATRPVIKFLLVCYSHYPRLASHGSLSVWTLLWICLLPPMVMMPFWLWLIGLRRWCILHLAIKQMMLLLLLGCSTSTLHVYMGFLTP